MIKLKRIYEQSSKNDGFRILVDRLWPRGVSKEDAEIDLWLKEIAPGDELRKWYSHDMNRWEQFRESYMEELNNMSGQIDKIKEIEKEHGTITLLYSAKDESHNNAVVLREFLENKPFFNFH